MVLNTEELKEVCTKILTAVDTSEAAILTETLELKTEGEDLLISVTNKEYYVQVRLNLGTIESFHATINASLFLKLISQITTEDITLVIKNNALNIVGNGNYKLPLIYNGDKLLELPTIEIEEPSIDMYIDSNTLLDILKYNGKEIAKGAISRPVQRYYYVDEKGAITFTSGACVNNFNLDKPVKMLLSNKVVKLFKLFAGESVQFILGHSAINNDIIQTRVQFKSAHVALSAILTNDDELINSIPVTAIRGRADKVYPFIVNINRTALLQAINRLMIFSDRKTGTDLQKSVGIFDFGEDELTIKSPEEDNDEVVVYTNNCAQLQEEPYRAFINLKDLRATLETLTDMYVMISFGDHQAFVFPKQNIKIIIPECTLTGGKGNA